MIVFGFTQKIIYGTENLINKSKKIIFNFVGLYDTVAAFGVDHRGKKLGKVVLLDNDTRQLNLDAISKARYVLHLASDDEYRDNFDLTNIQSAGLCGFELMLPGVHSDIGGSYLNKEETSVLDTIGVGGIAKEKKEEAERQKSLQYDLFIKIVVEEGWYNKSQLEKRFFEERELDKFASWYSNAYQYNYGLVGIRDLKNTYDKIPLKIMINKSKDDFGLKYLKTKLNDNEINDPIINNVYNNMVQYINACVAIRNEYVDKYNGGNKQNFNELSKEYYEKLKTAHYSSYITPEDLKQLRNLYLHWSVKSNLIGLAARHEGALPQDQRKREKQNG